MKSHDPPVISKDTHNKPMIHNTVYSKNFNTPVVLPDCMYRGICERNGREREREREREVSVCEKKD